MAVIMRKRSPIIAIAVHAKLNPGDVWYNADAWYATPRIEILTRPYYRKYKTIPGGDWWVKYTTVDGHVYEKSLADAGFPGFSYDDRPFKWVLTEEEIAARKCDIDNWLDDYRG